MAISTISDRKAVTYPGAVLQVVQVTYSTQTTTSSATFSDTGLTASITPTSATSKILVVVHHAGCFRQSNNTYAEYQLLRGASVVSLFESGQGYTGTSTANYTGSVSTAYLDSPATTSSTTYKSQFRAVIAAAQVGCQNNASISTITLMEIAA